MRWKSYKIMKILFHIINKLDKHNVNEFRHITEQVNDQKLKQKKQKITNLLSICA